MNEEMKTVPASHTFVRFIPRDMDDGMLYISLEYAVIVHRCFCGCRSEVVTPLSPNDWRMIFDGESVSLWPSVGNWSFQCKSHYWIWAGQVVWARKWSQDEINSNRATVATRRHRDQGPWPNPEGMASRLYGEQSLLPQE